MNQAYPPVSGGIADTQAAKSYLRSSAVDGGLDTEEAPEVVAQVVLDHYIQSAVLPPLLRTSLLLNY